MCSSDLEHILKYERKITTEFQRRVLPSTRLPTERVSQSFVGNLDKALSLTGFSLALLLIVAQLYFSSQIFS